MVLLLMDDAIKNNRGVPRFCRKGEGMGDGIWRGQLLAACTVMVMGVIVRPAFGSALLMATVSLGGRRWLLALALVSATAEMDNTMAVYRC